MLSPSQAQSSLRGTNGDPVRKTKADESLRLLTQGALSAFPMNEATELFREAGGGQAQEDLLQKYRDITALPMQMRRGAYRKALPKDRSNLWKTHLALCLVN